MKYPLKGIGTIPGIYLTQKFGENLHPYPGMLGHNGIDWAAPKGTPVLAVHDGQLITKPLDPDGYGIYVRVQWQEDGFTYDSVYGHFDKIEGEDRQVKAGNIIGYVDSTGNSTGHHLHFGLRKKLNGTIVDYNNGYLGYFDPQPFFKKDNFQMIYKKKDLPTLYFGVGAVLIPFATDYNAYLKDFADAIIIELPDEEFVKFKVSDLKIKT